MKPRIWWTAGCDCGWSYPPKGSFAVKVDLEEQVKRHRGNCLLSTTGV